MRLWSLHPQYLDPQGLVALWREALLAQAVLRGETKGYRHHPQLQRFRDCPAPLAAMSLYLSAIYKEAQSRGYAFDKSKIRATRKRLTLTVTRGQLDYEWAHLMRKLRCRRPNQFRQLEATASPKAHPLFKVRRGGVAAWERV